ncbi:MAG: hypothetical protein IT210_25995 [Armatimonadetes bacterium]|nr:hypothetical protein [Armatimonadota bacterium]
MNVVYLANVGTRDVQLKGEKLPKPRSQGAELAAQYETISRHLTTPILSAGIRKVLENADTIALVQLFVSDQPQQGTPENFRDQDTCEFGKLIPLLLREEFGSRIKEIQCEPMRFNPSDYNRTLPFFADRLHTLVPPETVDVAYIAPVGGVDACNVGLTVNAVRLYRQKCQFIYVTPDSQAHPLNLHREFLADYAKEQAGAHLKRHDYIALKEVLKKESIGEPWHRSLCDYADRRISFDFKKALEYLKSEQAAVSGDDITTLTRLAASVRLFTEKHPVPLSDTDDEAWNSWFHLQESLLRELYFNLQLKADKGEWVDFLGRLFRMQEALLHLVFEKVTKHSAEKIGDSFPKFQEAIESDAELKSFLCARKTRWTEPNIRNLSDCLTFWVKKGGEYQKYGALKGIMDKINEGERLSGLRNKSIIAHGYQGIGPADIETALNKINASELMYKIRTALGAIGVTVNESDNPYKDVQKLLEEAIR